MVSSAWTSGVFALAGVIIGGSLNLASGVILDHRREQRDIRTVARLIVNELIDVEVDLRMALTSEKWDPLKTIDVGRWIEHERELAVSLTNSDWHSIQAIYKSVALFADEAGYEVADDPMPMGADDLAHLRLTLDVLSDALSRMRVIAGLQTQAQSDAIAGDTYERYIEAYQDWIKARGVPRTD
jgi:hypothetical protein